MKAVVYTKYGSPDVLHFTETDKPFPKDDEVLIKVYAAALNAADWRLLRAKPFIVRLFNGFINPKFHILGADIAGRVEAVGSNVKQFKPGDEVFAELGLARCGGLAEYVCGLEYSIALKPANLSFEEAAAVPMAALTALQGFRDVGQIKAGQKVLINGASGGVGTFAVQIAKSFGAEVTAVCSARNLETARSIGADHVIDYTKEDFTKSGKKYDIIFAANGYHSIFDYKRSLTPNGIYVLAGGSSLQMFQAMFIAPLISKTGDKKMKFLSAKVDQNDLNFLREIIEAGKLKPVIDRRYPLSETADAFRYIDEGHAKGKVVIVVEQS